ncbi:family 1 glycoside hydrolase [Thelonectria olida]|uniref:Family 1 glycoside hydrolase n=1 Tax=Thelonectria olida TaxID=1576542 RepID=A0A9P9ARD5_9HYPO|nr:family 1 glycoside hydrolase [Thelonectria olida]
MASLVQLFLALAPLTFAQQVYLHADGPTRDCKATKTGQPKYHFTPFSYTLTDTVRYATSVPAPTSTTTYADPPESLVTLVPSLSFTTWGKWDPNGTQATDTDDPYGQAAWTSLWEHANPPNFTETAVFSTTVSPTPIPSSELVLPPKDYFGPTDCYSFPKGFAFGVSSSASQIEGATADEGKAPSLMDILIRDDRPKDYVTNEHYYYYKQDIERVAAMGAKHFSFSIAWTRILPFALPGTPVNQEGVDHYNDVINYVLEKGMTPEVTLLHFDTPLTFYGNLSTAADRPELGYVNGAYQNETFEDAFVHYAKVAMSHYADRVPTWFTFNEPLLYSYNAKAVNHVVKAHARVYHWYKEDLRGKGRISLKFNDNFGVPRNPKSKADVYAADHFNSIQLGPFCNPIFLGKDYPESFKQTFDDYVPLSKKDLEYIGGTADFLGIDPYTATVISPPVADDEESVLECASNSSATLRPYCVNQTTTNVYGWDIGYRSETYVYMTPTYLRSYLNYLHNTWRTPVAITEFGFPVFGEADKDLVDQLFDTPRSQYYLGFMSEVLKAIWEDGVEVVGAYAWSAFDNWEFGSYEAQFGIQTVNRTTQERRFKKSFFDLVDFMKARGVE